MVVTLCSQTGLEPAAPTRQQVHLITGGGGFAGFRLGKRLAAHGHKVILLDVREPIWTMTREMEFVQGDLTKSQLTLALFNGVDCVYHMASYGMSGREQLQVKRIEAVNVTGTENVIKACIDNNVMRLVYTSTYNTIFGGQTIEDGDETLPYLPLDKHPDHYSRTKSIAEQKVLAANGSETKNGQILHTCTVRLAAVYGPGEQRHIPRIVDYIERGLFSIIYETNTLQDFLHVDNLTQAHELAGKALTEENSYIAAGQAYFISDEAPINTFTFFQPLIEGLGYPMPSIRLPVSLIYFIAFLTEWLHYIISGVYNFQPLLTRTEVYKTGITHYFSTKKAQQQLGYKPTIQNDISKVVQHYINTGHKKQSRGKETKLRQASTTDDLVNIEGTLSDQSTVTEQFETTTQSKSKPIIPPVNSYVTVHYDEYRFNGKTDENMSLVKVQC